jgi:hypothetical protein
MEAFGLLVSLSLSAFAYIVAIAFTFLNAKKWLLLSFVLSDQFPSILNCGFHCVLFLKEQHCYETEQFIVVIETPVS